MPIGARRVGVRLLVDLDLVARARRLRRLTKNIARSFLPAPSGKFKFSPNTSVIALCDKSSSVSSSGSGPAAGAGFSGFGRGLLDAPVLADL